MRVYDSILDAVGNTPMVRLSRLGRGLEPTILAKVEYLNPGGSVKDRIGLAMVEIAGAFQPNQYANQANPEAHYASTGPEIWEQTDGTVDVLVVASAPAGPSP